MIIGIAGKIGSGKDLVGKIIQYHLYMAKEVRGRYYPPEVFIDELDTVDLNEVTNSEIKKYADKLKDILCLLLGCTREQLEDRNFKEKELGEEWWYWKLERDGGYSTILLPYNDSTGTEDYTLTKLTPRLLLQLLGTQCGRQIIHPNIWVNALMSEYRPIYWNTIRNKETLKGNYDYYKSGLDDKTLDNIEERFPNWIITDVRFPNELEAIKDKGGITIRVNRDTELRYPKLWEEFHSSEFDEWDDFLKNVKQFDKVYHDSETSLDFSKFDYTIENNGTIEELIEKVKEILITEKII